MSGLGLLLSCVAGGSSAVDNGAMSEHQKRVEELEADPATLNASKAFYIALMDNVTKKKGVDYIHSNPNSACVTYVAVFRLTQYCKDHSCAVDSIIPCHDPLIYDKDRCEQDTQFASVGVYMNLLLSLPELKKTCDKDAGH